jgi:redox-sensitive bicupin YhaK (pirin superfamily)
VASGAALASERVHEQDDAMITVRPGRERGHTRIGWLDSRHSFSFGDYYDPDHMGFHTLRVINEDRVTPGAGFGTHAHRDMEILSWVLGGTLAHKDSMGNGGHIRPGELQRMSAGTGVRHSEMNPSADEPVHFLQIWIMPEEPGVQPGYEQRAFPESERRGALRLVASRGGREGSVSLNQDADVYATVLEAGAKLEHVLRPGRRAWVQVTEGAVVANGARLDAGDGAGIVDEPSVRIEAADPAALLVFDLG